MYTVTIITIPLQNKKRLEFIYDIYANNGEEDAACLSFGD